MTNSVQAAAIPFLSGRNRIINGDMRIAQRAGAQTFTTSAAGYGQCDRWRFNNGTSGGTFTLAQNTTLTDENGIAACFNVLTATVAATSISGSTYVGGHLQLIEGFNAADLLGKPVTVSFTVRASVPGTYGANLRTGVGDYSCVQLFNIPVANTPYRITLTFPAIPSGANIPLSNAQGLQISIGALNTGTYQAPSAGSWQAGNYISAPGLTNWAATLNATFAITNVQLEAGPEATPFERRSYSQELAFCQRYYQTVALLKFWCANAAASSTFGQTITLPVVMRATPTLANGTPTYSNATGATFESISTVILTCYASPTTTGQSCWASVPNITLNSEL